MTKILILFLTLSIVSVNSTHAQYTESDTLRAITNQFKRKKTGGIVRAVIGTGLAVLIATASTEDPEPTVVTRPSAPGYTLTTTYTQENNASTEGNIFGAVVFSGVAISGIVQAVNYSNSNLEKALELYRNEKRLLRKARFRVRDFRPKP
ncbi:MAG TPA: hypothetical protein VD884_09955 [Ohtaekwangia sp.]|nr:hypothetical protein [Ohtaekwangia sp.]